MKLIQQKSRFKLIITDTLEHKIRTLCSHIYNDEWSGVLYYTEEGTFEEDNLVLTACDLLLMDKGSSAYTEFKMSPDIVGNYVDHPELQDCYMGLVHSHNNMATFFSGTDTATLQEEGGERDHFLSLIVNNEGTYSAAITRKIHIKENITFDRSYSTFNSRFVQTSAENKIVEYDAIEYFMLDIERPETTMELENKIAEIIKMKTHAPSKLQWFNTLANNNNKKAGTQTFINFDNYSPTPTFGKPQAKGSGIDIDLTSKEAPAKQSFILQNDGNRSLLKELLCQLISFNLFVTQDMSFDEDAPTKDIVESLENVYNIYFSTIDPEKTDEIIEHYVEMIFSLATSYGFTLEEAGTFFKSELDGIYHPIIEDIITNINFYMS